MEALVRFANRLGGNTGAQEELESFGLQLERSLLEIKGRLFAPEKITSGGGACCPYQSTNAEWSRSLRYTLVLKS